MSPATADNALDSEVERLAPHIKTLVENLEASPEKGYEEHRTAEIVATFAETHVGGVIESGLALTGIRLDVGDDGYQSVAALGELDALPMPEHRRADPNTGMAHACGHHLQLAIALCAVISVVRSGILEQYGGRISFIATPAEETVDVERKLGLRSDGLIRFLGGKQEMMRLGVFDDVRAFILVHASGRPETRRIGIGGRTVSHLIKRVTFHGRAAHAGARPDLGINAQRAAAVGLAALDAVRERYIDGSYVRLHPRLTLEPGAVNIIPSEATLDAYVRALESDDLEIANADFDRAMMAGALGLGGSVVIETVPGYLPMSGSVVVQDIVEAAARDVVGSEAVGFEGLSAATTDVADLSWALPGLQITAGGMRGQAHSHDFEMADFEAAVLDPARVVARTLAAILADPDLSLWGSDQPRMSIQEIVDLLDSRAYRLEFHGTEDFGNRTGL